MDITIHNFSFHAVFNDGKAYFSGDNIAENAYVHLINEVIPESSYVTFGAITVEQKEAIK